MNTIENHMAYWQQLIELAKKGVGSQTDWQPVDQLLKEANLATVSSAESKFYHALTLLHKFDRVAREPAINDVVLPVVPADELLPASKKSAEVMIEAITFKDWALLEEALRIIKSQNRRVHPWALPAILSACKAQPSLFGLLKMTAGRRCDWLAAHQNQWRWWLRLDETSAEEVPAEELFSWITWKRKKGQLDNSAIEALKERERKQLWSEMTENALPIDEVIARQFLVSKSSNERSQARCILMQISTSERARVKGQVESYCQATIMLKKNLLTYDDSAYKEDLPDEYLDIAGTSTSDPSFLQLLTFFGPATIFGHLLLPIHDIFTQLVEDKNLEKLFTAIVHCCARLETKEPDRLALVLAWLVHYPSGNSLVASLERVLGKLSYDSVQLVFGHLLQDNSDYFLEKLLKVCANTDQYIGKELSMSLVEKIFDFVRLPLGRTQVGQLGEAIQHLQYLLDPRTSQTISTHWTEIDYRHKKLAETLYEFRETIKRRSILLASIVH